MGEAATVSAIDAIPSRRGEQLPISVRRLTTSVAQRLPTRTGMVHDIALVMNLVLPAAHEWELPGLAFRPSLAGSAISAVNSFTAWRAIDPVAAGGAVDTIAPVSAVSPGLAFRPSLAGSAVSAVDAVATGGAVCTIAEAGEPLSNVGLDAAGGFDLRIEFGKPNTMLRFSNLTLALRLPTK